MSDKGQQLYRKEALEKLSTPERLDELVQIVAPRDWLIFLCFGVLLAGGLVWSIVGRLPTTVSGNGVLLYPRKTIEFQSPGPGRLMTFNLKAGDFVKQGDVIGAIDQAEIRKRLDEDTARLAALRTQDVEKRLMHDQQRQLLAQEIDTQKKYYQMQVQNYGNSIRDAEALVPVLKRQLDSQRAMLEQGLIPKVSKDLLEAERDYLANQAKISDWQAQLKDVESRVRQLDSKEQDLARQILDSTTTRKNEIQVLEADIALYAVQLQKSGQILSEYEGRILELAVNVGQVLSAGQRLGLIETKNRDNELVCLAYFPVRDGKRIKPGMTTQTTPDTVKRERFGGILGTVTSVSSFPANRKGASLLLGDSDLAEQLLKEGLLIEVFIRLESDGTTRSGYRWSSSKGPELQVSSGTTTSSRVTVEERAPITYVFPFLRSMSGIY